MGYYKFQNGFELIFKKQKGTGVCALFLGIKSGSFYEPDNLSGISHFIEHLLFKRKETPKIIEGLGGYINAYTSLDETVFYITIPVENFKKAIYELKNLVFNLNITPEDVELEKSIVIEELRGGNDNPFKILYENSFKSIFKNLGYKKPVIGYEDVIKNFTYNKIVDYYKKHYCPANSTLIIVGDLLEKDVHNEAYHIFNSLNQTNSEDLKTFNYDFTPINFTYKPVKTSFKQYYLSIGFKVPEFNSKDFLALDIFSNFFGSGESSILTKVLKKEKHLVDEITCDIYPLRYSNLFLITSIFSKEKSPTIIINEIFQLIEKYYKKSLSLSEIEKSIINLKSELFFDMENASSLGKKLIFYHLITGNYKNEDLYLKNLSKISNKDIKNALKKWIKKDYANITLLFPEDKNLELEKDLKLKKEKEKKSIQKLRKKINLTLDNGIKIIFEKISRTPLIAFKIGGLGGLKFENEKTNGLSYITAKYLTKGTKNLCENEIFEKIEGKGGELFAFSGRNSIGIGGYSLKEEFSDIFEIINEIIFYSNFPEDKFIRIKSEIINKIKAEKDNPYDFSMKFFYKNIFKNHHYGFDIKGSEKNVKNFKIEQLRDFYKKIFVPENLVFSFAGDLDFGHIDKVVSSLEGLSSNKKLKIPESVAPEFNKSKIIKEEINKNQAHIITGFIAPEAYHKDYYPLKLIKHAIGNTSGRLFNEIRERLGLCYAIFPFYLTGIDGGCFGIYIATHKNYKNKAINEIDRLIENLINSGLSIDEIENAKNYILGNYKISKQRYITVAGNNFFNLLYNQGIDFEKKYLKKIKNLTKNKIDNTIQKYFVRPRLTVIMS